MTPTPLSPQVQEWRDKAMQLADDHALWYSQTNDAPNPGRRAALLAHLDAVPFNQVVQEPTGKLFDAMTWAERALELADYHRQAESSKAHRTRAALEAHLQLAAKAPA